MRNRPEPWDYLIVTAAHEQQAKAYELQIRTRREIGRLGPVRKALVVPDAGGRRVGSGGSTVQCLIEVLRHEAAPEQDFDAAEAVLRRLRILIVHAGGDSRRLPAYAPCGKIFVPLPSSAPSALTPTLFDRLVPAFLDLPETPRHAGQIVIAAGDALILFDPSEVSFSREGITALGAAVSPAEAARHGVLCPNPDGAVRIYLQKPGIGEQAEAGAIGGDGRSVLDVGVMNLDAHAAARLLRAFSTPSARAAILSPGIDLYREICCALGTEATVAHYLAAARSSGSRVEEPVLTELFDALRFIPLNLQVLRQCSFLHFGSTRQLITSGIELVRRDHGAPSATMLDVCNDIQPEGSIDGVDCWVEGCRVSAPLTLRRGSVMVGADVLEPFELPEGACLDISPGVDRHGDPSWFVRYYGVDDSFKHAIAEGATFCGHPLLEWLRATGAHVADLWNDDTPEDQRTLWNARIFVAEKEPGAYSEWRWMLDARNATLEQRRQFLAADRYSAAEIAPRVDQGAFHRRRAAIRASEIRRFPGRAFGPGSTLGARDLAFALRNADDRARMIADLLVFAREHPEHSVSRRVADLVAAAIEGPGAP